MYRYHQYKFIVDGEWRHDETQPFMPDPLGNVNNWLFVRRPEQNQNTGYIFAECVALFCHGSNCTTHVWVMQDSEQQLTAVAVTAATAAATPAAVDARKFRIAASIASSPLPA